MQVVTLLLATIALCYGYINKELIEEVNAKKAGWIAGENPIWRGKDLSEIKSIFGHRKDLEKPLPGRPTADPTLAVPTSFVAAQNWPHCKTIGTIYNQARCGSCWAFGGVEAASDRFCIATNGAFNEPLSFAQVVECDTDADGCEVQKDVTFTDLKGGSTYAVWSFLSDNGVVTDQCYPYFIPTCKPSEQPCLNFVDTPDCWNNNTCVRNGLPWKVYKIGNAYNLNSVSDIQRDIMTKGPVEACFSVYEDFLSYKTGVYKHVTGSYLGGHCVKIQGWGVENGTPYWLVNNQWTTYWGDNGQFKIALGTDECGIEDDVAAGDPVIN